MDVEKYLSGFFMGTKNPSMKAMQYFMKEFNHPDRDLKVIHIAGTNGKGSCAQTIANILINAGYKVGKFTTPFLINRNEIINVQNKDISNKDMERLILKLKPKIDKYNTQNNENVTLFEIETTMAILYFYEQKCDFVILETGLGGLYDCTNIIEKPITSIITSIGYDHMDILGNTLTKIAVQKAGIIKNESETIFVAQTKDVNDVIIKTCKEKHNILHLIKKEDISNYTYNKVFQMFDYKNYKQISINLKGEKQIYNSSIAIECIEILRNKGYSISDELLRNSLKTVVHKARLETLNKEPLIIYDGAHNEPAINNFIKSINMYYKDNKKVYVISILNTKDYKTILEKLLKDENSIFIFTSGNDKQRFIDKNELLKTAKNCTTNENLFVYELIDAIDYVKKEYKNYVIFFVGSFYIYKTVINRLRKDNND